MPSDAEEWVTVTEAMAIKQVARNSVRDAIRRGDVRAQAVYIRRKGPRIVVSREDLNRWNVDRRKGWRRERQSGNPSKD